MVYMAHHEFFTPYMDVNKTIVVMDNTGKLTMTNDSDGKGSNKTEKVIVSLAFLDLISKVCPSYVETRASSSLRGPPSSVPGTEGPPSSAPAPSMILTDDQVLFCSMGLLDLDKEVGCLTLYQHSP